MNDTPIYDELVVKYYLSKQIVPFSYPHRSVFATPGGPIKAGQIIGIAADLSNARSRYFDLKG